MLVFIDESGDPGFRIAEGSSSLFVAAMVIFDDPVASQHTANKIAQLRAQLRVHPEFKFSKCRDQVRDQFFEAVRGDAFLVRAIVVSKELLYSPRLRSKKEDFYRYFVKSMVTHHGGRLQEAKIVIDGSGDRSFQKDLKVYLRTHVQTGVVREVVLKNSRSDPLIQLADMCVGAIARSYRKERANTKRWRQMLEPRLDDVWEFK